MKPSINKLSWTVVQIAVLSLTTNAFGKSLLEGFDFSELEAKAAETVDITLDTSMLKLASKFLAKSGDDAEVRELVNNLEGIYVKVFEFDKAGAYDKSLAKKIRKLVPKDFKRIVSVRSKNKDNVEIYARPTGDKLNGLVIIAAEPKSFALINLVGLIDIDKLSKLEGQFGVPQLGLEAAANKGASRAK